MTDKTRNLAIQHGVVLAPRTTFGIGGEAEFFGEFGSVRELQTALAYARGKGWKVTILGGGSNVLISDQGLSGLVVVPALKNLDVIKEDDNEVRIKVGAGVVWDDFVSHSVQAGFAGIECLSGIPGWVGAAPIQNIGAYGQEVSSSIQEVEVMSLVDGQSFLVRGDACGFGYRESNFKKDWLGKYLVTGVVFCLSKTRVEPLVYRDLIRAFGKTVVDDLSEIRKCVLNIRRQKSMVIDDHDLNSKSAGSFFTNVVVDESELRSLKSALSRMGILEESLPLYPTEGGKRFKVPAAWLIEKAGFSKGYRMGRAGLSEKHTLAIINAEQAGATDILALANTIGDRVHELFQVTLIREPTWLGD
ncbi:MAG: UDP-N-acetylmuramate dehydrogenase [Myxococcota bacterium]|nr:UDP-N-acetylmuramate dehydrogenase [Myxococcota bacterium]